MRSARFAHHRTTCGGAPFLNGHWNGRCHEDREEPPSLGHVFCGKKAGLTINKWVFHHQKSRVPPSIGGLALSKDFHGSTGSCQVTNHNLYIPWNSTTCYTLACDLQCSMDWGENWNRKSRMFTMGTSENPWFPIKIFPPNPIEIYNSPRLNEVVASTPGFTPCSARYQWPSCGLKHIGYEIMVIK